MSIASFFLILSPQFAYSDLVVGQTSYTAKVLWEMGGNGTGPGNQRRWAQTFTLSASTTIKKAVIVAELYDETPDSFFATNNLTFCKRAAGFPYNTGNVNFECESGSGNLKPSPGATENWVHYATTTDGVPLYYIQDTTGIELGPGEYIMYQSGFTNPGGGTGSIKSFLANRSEFSYGGGRSTQQGIVSLISPVNGYTDANSPWLSWEGMDMVFALYDEADDDPLGTDDFGDLSTGATRIIVTDPANDETIATSTAYSFGATGFVAQQDYEDGIYLEIKYAPYSAMQSYSGASPDLLFTTLSIPISGPGVFMVSTTSPVITPGEYTMQSTIKQPSLRNSVLNFLGFGQFATFGILSATSTEFIASHLTGYDIFVASTTASLEAYLASSTVSLASCSSWTSFNLGDCLELMLVPQKQPISKAMSDFKDKFLSYFPWGYLTRVVLILTNSTPTSLPSFTTTIPISPTQDLDILTIDMADMIEGGGIVLNQAVDPYSGENLQEIVQPWIRLFIALTILFIVIHDIQGTAHHASRRHA